VRRAERPRRSDAPLNAAGEGRSRHAGLAATAVLAVLAAAAARLLPVSEAALGSREERFLSEAGRALDADAARMVETAARIQRSSEFRGVVDGGGAEVRPARLFTILASALPGDPGWGIVFLDATGRAVAWTGEPMEIEEELGRAEGGIAVAFHTARFTVAWSSPRVVAGERRGLLVVSRRYPTGLLRPDLIEFFDLRGGPASSGSPSNGPLPAHRAKTRPGPGRSSRPWWRPRSSPFSESSPGGRPRGFSRRASSSSWALRGPIRDSGAASRGAGRPRSGFWPRPPTSS